MKTNFTIQPSITHIGLKVELTPVRMSLKSGKNLWAEISKEKGGNPLLRVDEEHGTLVAVDQVERVGGMVHDHSKALDGEMVWICDSCGAYSKTKQIVDDHELKEHNQER